MQMDMPPAPRHNDRGPRARGDRIMTTPTEALRTIMPIAGWGDTQAADVDEARIGDGADRVVEDLGKRRVAGVFPIVELDAPHQVARVAERRHPPAVDAVAGVADRFRERPPRSPRHAEGG